MKNTNRLLALLIFITGWVACRDNSSPQTSASQPLKQLFANYWEERLKLFPLEATAYGDDRYNDKMPISISASYRDTIRSFYQKYLDQAKAIDKPLNFEDQMSKDLFMYEMEISFEGLKYPAHLMPINQFWSFTLEFPQLGSGDGNQPFKTVKDYDDFLKRMKIFPAWADTAIANMRKGMKLGYVLPKVLALKVIPQLRGVITTDVTKNIFYQPILKLPEGVSPEDKKRLTAAYSYEIVNSMIPAYNKLAVFVEKEYLPSCRNTSGMAALPKGDEYYQYLIHYYTTTNLKPDSIYQLGLKEVARLKAEMIKVKDEVKFNGTLEEFFQSINTDPQFYPFTTAKEVLDSFRAIQSIEEPFLKQLFKESPKTGFEIRQTEAYRAASASAEYNAGSEDGKRPGIFYVPILDPKKFNIVGMETLFLHEAIPGHHYQISLQQENTTLPKFRRFLGYSAYAEGWALYTETLGRKLGLYKNPYQYLGHLSDAMHRAIRLVVDAGLHTRNMSREEAIAYMRANERISEEEATAEIERYMAIPGQALSYKIGQLTISAMKEKYQAQLGDQFNEADFHTQLLNGGNMPLEILEKKLAHWAGTH
ncbi:MAG: DUF885 domain-containing protein [Chitinophagaceae bacterium]|nr:DUF885 domain-containing protein [Chitinophagaceae bacterium]